MTHKLIKTFSRIGEACSHVATVLSCIVKAHESRQNSNSCTSQACQWLPPAKNVSM